MEPRLLFALLLMLAAPGAALAQDGSQDQSQDQPGAAAAVPPAPADPIVALEGIWRVDRAEGSAAGDGTLMGRLIRIGRAVVPSLTAGTCTNPGFTATGAAPAGRIEITCLGQTLATAEWSSADADTLNWSEADLQAVLHRIAGANPLKATPPAAGSAAGQNGDPGPGEDGGGDSGSDSPGSSGSDSQ